MTTKLEQQSIVEYHEREAQLEKQLELRVVELVNNRHSVPIDNLALELDGKDLLSVVRSLIGMGYLYLVVVQRLWGVELHLEMTEQGQNYMTEELAMGSNRTR